MGLFVARLHERCIVDISMRMLQPRELARPRASPATISYRAKTQQVHHIGNSVSPYPAEAVLRANDPFRMRAAA